MAADKGSELSAGELAVLVASALRPPMVTAHGVGPEGDLPAALLVWGHHMPSRRWAAGVAFLYHVFRGAPIRALVTVWLPAMQVSRLRGHRYGSVPRIALAGAGPEQWPLLPPVYPGVTREWVADHHHAIRVDPARRYGLVPAPVHRRSRLAGPDGGGPDAPR